MPPNVTNNKGHQPDLHKESKPVGSFLCHPVREKNDVGEEEIDHKDLSFFGHQQESPDDWKELILQKVSGITIGFDPLDASLLKT